MSKGPQSFCDATANDKHIKTCISRYDSGTYTRVPFLRAVGHSVGSDGSVLCEDFSALETADAADDDVEDRVEQPDTQGEHDHDL